jgi:hypothetical protein
VARDRRITATDGYVELLKTLTPADRARLIATPWAEMPAPRAHYEPDGAYDYDANLADVRIGAADNAAEERAERAAERRFDAMTDKQRAYLASLIESRGTDAHRALDLDVVDRVAASRLIDELKSAPIRVPACRFDGSTEHSTAQHERDLLDDDAAAERAAAAEPLPDVPNGRYAVELGEKLKFYVVTRGRLGAVRVRAQASDALHDVSPSGAVGRAALDAIAVDPRAAAERYGRELGKCGCCGRTLTDAASRANGLGPDCVEHFGKIGGSL